MVLSGLEPFGVLPSWMYHAQEPPPSHIFNPNLPGITWVDLVFPFFIFSMGAAFPLAFSKKISMGFSTSRLVWQTLKRGILLLAFAIYNQHFNPQVLSNNPTASTCILALTAFLLMFPIWGQFPWKMNLWFEKILKYGTWIAVILILAFLKYPDNSGFSLFRSNIILLILANLAFWGSLIWLLTKKNIKFRLCLMGFFLAIYISNSIDTSWIHTIRTQCEIPFIAAALNNISQQASEHFKWLYNISWMFNWSFMKYLFIIIPATIIGEMLQENLKLAKSRSFDITWNSSKYFIITCVMFIFDIMILAGLKARWSAATFFGAIALYSFGFILLRKPDSNLEKMLKQMYLWGGLWLMLGLLFEPYEGGIKKDPSTLSYYFVCSGLAIFTLIALNIILDVFQKQKYLKILIGCGQNPMIAYVSSGNLLFPILGLIGAFSPMVAFGQKMPWVGFFIAVGFTLLIAVIVSIFSYFKFFVRT
jgi:hypothetical protein